MLQMQRQFKLLFNALQRFRQNSHYLVAFLGGAHIVIGGALVAQLALFGPTTKDNDGDRIANEQKNSWNKGQQGKGEPIVPLV